LINRAQGRDFKNFPLYFFNILKSLVIVAKLMPIANVNRIFSENLQSARQFLLIRQPIANWHLFFHHTNITHFYWECCRQLYGLQSIKISD